MGGVWLAGLGISWPSAGMDDIMPGGDGRREGRGTRERGGVGGVGGPEVKEAGTTARHGAGEGRH